MDDNRQPLLTEASAACPEPQIAASPGAPESPAAAKMPRSRSTLLPRLIAAGLCCMVVVYCKIQLPQQCAWLQRWVIGDGSEQIQQAFFRFDEALQNGAHFYTAVGAFCDQLTDEAV